MHGAILGVLGTVSASAARLSMGAFLGMFRMRRLVLAAISAYQRHVSPHKGFYCAYRVHTGRQSCSVLGYRAVRRYGVIAGLVVLQRRTHRCGVTHRRFSPTQRRPHRTQRGDCDVGCDSPFDFNCDARGGKSCLSFADCSSACDCGSCDGFRKWRKENGREQHVHIPPKARCWGEQPSVVATRQNRS